MITNYELRFMRDMMVKELLTIVIPCKNENITIQNTLEYLNKQMFLLNKFGCFQFYCV